MGDLDALHELFSDPAVMRYFPSTRTRDESETWLRKVLATYESHGFGLWASLRKLDGAFLGYIGLIPQEVDGVDEVEIGYSLAQRHWGQGFATEGAIACRDHAFGDLDRDRLISIIDPRNEPSIRVARRVGMSFEKRTVKWNLDVAIYSIRRASSTR
jgi:ribosomal-protein-alanine N-acetyltransferase